MGVLEWISSNNMSFISILKTTLPISTKKSNETKQKSEESNFSFSCFRNGVDMVIFIFSQSRKRGCRTPCKIWKILFSLHRCRDRIEKISSTFGSWVRLSTFLKQKYT